MSRFDTPHLRTFYERYDAEIAPWLAQQEPRRKKAKTIRFWGYLIGIPALIILGASLEKIVGDGAVYNISIIALVIAALAGPVIPYFNLKDDVEKKLKPLLIETLKLRPTPKEQHLDTKPFMDTCIVEEHDIINPGEGFSGQHDDVDFSLQNFHLRKRNFKGSYKNYSVFQGTLILCRFPKPFAETTLLLRENFVLKTIASQALKGKLQRVNLGYQEFEKNFEVYATDQVMCRALMTPDVIMSLTELRTGIPGCKWMQAAMIGSYLLIAVYTSNPYEFKVRNLLKHPLTESTLADNFSREIGLIHEIIDKLDMLKRKPRIW